MSSGPETRLVNRITKAINDMPGCKVEKNHGTQFGKPKLDLTGAVGGFMFQLEVKTKGKKPTVRQEAIIKDWQRVGVHAGWCDSLEGALEFVGILQKQIEEMFKTTEDLTEVLEKLKEVG